METFFSEKMVEFNQSLEPTFVNMISLPRKEGSETYNFQDKGKSSVLLEQSIHFFLKILWRFWMAKMISSPSMSTWTKNFSQSML